MWHPCSLYCIVIKCIGILFVTSSIIVDIRLKDINIKRRGQAWRKQQGDHLFQCTANDHSLKETVIIRKCLRSSSFIFSVWPYFQPCLCMSVCVDMSVKIYLLLLKYTYNFEITCCNTINHREKKGFTKVRQYVCMYVCSYVCLWDYSHTVQPRAFKFWHNIPYVYI